MPGGVGSTQRDEGRRQLDPRPGRLVRRAAALEPVDRVLEQGARPVVLAQRGREHALGPVGDGAERFGVGDPRDVPQRRERDGRLAEVAVPDPGVDEQLEGREAVERAGRGELAQEPLGEVCGLLRLARVERQAPAAELGAARRPGPFEQRVRFVREPAPPLQLGEQDERRSDPGRP